MNFKKAKFVKSTTTLKDAPKGRLKEILIVGRSNAGKSSLINALTGRSSLAFTSSKPGHTRLLNYFEIDESFYLVDAPGYGYAKGGIDLDQLFADMMNEYLVNNLYLKGALLLLDSRREFNELDLEMMEIFKKDKTNFLIVLTKSDKLNQSEKAKAIANLKKHGIKEGEYVFTSITNKQSILALEKEIENLLNK